MDFINLWFLDFRSGCCSHHCSVAAATSVSGLPFPLAFASWPCQRGLRVRQGSMAHSAQGTCSLRGLGAPCCTGQGVESVAGHVREVMGPYYMVCNPGDKETCGLQSVTNWAVLYYLKKKPLSHSSARSYVVPSLPSYLWHIVT